MFRWICIGGLVITGVELLKNGYVYLVKIESIFNYWDF